MPTINCLPLAESSRSLVSDDLPSAAALDAFEQLLSCGVRLAEISPDYRLFAKRQFFPKSENPGCDLFRYLQSHERWSNDLIDLDDIEWIGE